MLEMIFRRLVAVADSLLHVAMRDDRLTRRKRMVSLRVVLRCPAMMRRGLVIWKLGKEPRNRLLHHFFLMLDVGAIEHDRTTRPTLTIASP